MFRLRWLLPLLGMALLPGCLLTDPPQRTADYGNAAEVVRAYHDYLWLARLGVDSVRLREGREESVVSLPYYLFVIAQNLEKQGRRADAVKLYLSLLLNYPILDGNNQLGIRTENRVRWLLGDKRWIMPDSLQLIRRLQTALARQDLTELRTLMSRDFGVGWSEQQRMALDYQEGFRILAANLRRSEHIKIAAIDGSEPDRLRLRTTGWTGEYKVWYFSLHHRSQPEGWEWDLTYWDDGRR